MKRLTIIRHAKSSWNSAGLSDFDRPLNDRGEKNAPEMGRRLKDRGLHPDHIISSSANRAISTALHIAREINYPHSEIELLEDLYLADSLQVMSVIRKTRKHIAHLMLFAHNPGLTDLCNRLDIHVSIDNLPTCGIFDLTLNIENWSQLTEHCGSLNFFDYPKHYSFASE